LAAIFWSLLFSGGRVLEGDAGGGEDDLAVDTLVATEPDLAVVGVQLVLTLHREARTRRTMYVRFQSPNRTLMLPIAGAGTSGSV
jgi:hypothetical protein